MSELLRSRSEIEAALPEPIPVDQVKELVSAQLDEFIDFIAESFPDVPFDGLAVRLFGEMKYREGFLDALFMRNEFLISLGSFLKKSKA